MKFYLIIPIISILIIGVVSDDTETCSVDADGDCGDVENEVNTNFWQIGETGFSKDALYTHLKDLGEDMNALEMEIIMKYLDENKDRIISEEEFKKILNQRYDLIVKSSFAAFNTLDGDDNGHVTLEELQESLGENADTEELVLISLDMDTLPDGKLDILSFFGPLIRLGTDISKVLTPYLQLQHLLPLERKKAILGSIKMWKDVDIDDDGILGKEEYVKSMDRPLPNGKMLTDEQKLAVFASLDKNKDDEISFFEFQVLIPQKQKDMKENFKSIFKETDTNEDGFITQNELRDHLRVQSDLLKMAPPSDAEIEETFSKLDTDDDDKLTFDEMVLLVEEFKKMQHSRYSQAFKELDKDGDGILSKDEIQEIVKVMEERSGQNIDPDLLAKMLDKNGDGSVTFDEVNALIERFKSD